MMYTEQMYNNSLAHHGILGQKWGIRRFQNSDGSLTSAGKARYGDTSSIVSQQTKRVPSGAKVDGPTIESKKQQEEWNKKHGVISESNSKVELKKKDKKKFKDLNSHEKALAVGATAAAVTAGKVFINYQIADAMMGGQLKATPQTFAETAIRAGRNAVLAYAATRVLDNTFSTSSSKSNKKTQNKEDDSSRVEKMKQIDKDVSKKYSKGFVDYVHKPEHFGEYGFSNVDDDEMLELLEMEYEEKHGKGSAKAK